MSKPAIALVTWDSNGTHTTALTAGHKTDGWTASEVPTSAEVNAQGNGAWQWFAWLDGLWDSSGDLTLDNNAYVKVQGTGVYKRPARTRWIHGNAGIPTGSGSFTYDTTSGGLKPGASTNVFVFPITMQDDEQLTSVSLHYREDNVSVFTFKVWQYDSSNTTKSQLGSTQTSSGAQVADATLTVGSLTSQTGTSKTFWAEVSISLSVNAEIDQISYVTTVP